MGISSSLNAGVMGLSVNATRLATISDNIANSSTVGYKRLDTEFSSMVLNENSREYDAGGVQPVVRRDVTARGALQSTTNSTDLAVNGQGFLPVTDARGLLAATAESRPFMMTTTGSFRADESGYLRSASDHFLLGWPVDSSGNVQRGSRESTAGLELIEIQSLQFTAEPTTRMDLVVNLPADATLPTGSGDPYTLPVQYFDNLGRSETLSLTFTPSVLAGGAGTSNQWRLEIADSATGAAPIAAFDLGFDTTTVNGGTLASVAAVAGGPGGAYDAATGELTVNAARGPIQIDIGATDGTSTLTQLSSAFAPISIDKNGAGVGNLSAVEIDEYGYVEAIFDNGQRRTIYQVPLVDVANPNGLTATDGQAFQISHDSGGLYLWDAGTGPVGTTVSFALEQSTTDIADELTHLIETQRAYSSNAKIIQTVDEMLQETTNLKR